MNANNSSQVQQLVERGETLKTLGWRIIDAHAHLGPTAGFYIPSPSAPSMVALMDRVGIGRAIISSHMAINNDYARGNDLTAETVRAFPEHFAGYVVANPSYPESVVSELHRGLEQLGLVAIKLHPSMQRFSVLDPACAPAWRFAEERELPVLIHTWEGDSRCNPGAFAGLADTYPHVSFLLGHSGGTTKGRREAIAAAKDHPNIYLELCGSMLTSAEVAWMAAEVGAERLVFGTDEPWIDPRHMLGVVAFAGLSDEQLQLILGENARRIFGFA